MQQTYDTMPHADRRLFRMRSAACILALMILAACTAPPDVIDLSVAPQATRDAMLRVQILPLGIAAPPGVGSVALVQGYGCGVSASSAATDAILQLRAKALRVQATAVMDVLIAGARTGTCSAGHAATASGVAVAARGVPPTW